MFTDDADKLPERVGRLGIKGLAHDLLPVTNNELAPNRAGLRGIGLSSIRRPSYRTCDRPAASCRQFEIADPIVVRLRRRKLFKYLGYSFQRSPASATEWNPVTLPRLASSSSPKSL